MKFSFDINGRVTPRNKFVINYVGEVTNKEVLDVGCSYGWLGKALLRKNPKRIVGMEPKKEFFYNAPSYVPGAEFVVGSALKIPFNDNSFDTVILFETLEHLPQNTEKIAFKEIARILRSGGRLFLSTPNRHLISCFLDPAWFFGHRHYGANQLKHWLKEAGFEVSEVFFYGRFWELFRMIPHYFFKWILKKEDPLKLFFDKKIEKDGKKTNGYAYIYLKARKK